MNAGDVRILWPLVVMAALTFAVFVAMFRTRVGEMRSKRISPQSIPTSRELGARLENVTGSDNLRNLFELPVLFYTLCLALYVSDSVTTAQLALAWTYVGLRVAHSAIHLTYNKVMHRFRAFAASALVLLLMWALFALQLGS
jgi:hypothetical protein